MRHGVRASKVRDGAAQLGCYYCNDIVAPADVRSSLPLTVVLLFSFPLPRNPYLTSLYTLLLLSYSLSCFTANFLASSL
jgi:hypothetical protein